jgi:spore germination protein YaaH
LSKNKIINKLSKKIVLPSDIYQIWEMTMDVKVNKEPHFEHCYNPDGKEKCTDYHAESYLYYADWVLSGGRPLSHNVTEIRDTDKYVIQRLVLELAIDFDPDSKISIVNLKGYDWLKEPEDRIRLAVDIDPDYELLQVFEIIAETHRKIM